MGCCRPFCAGRRDRPADSGRPPVFPVARLPSLGYRGVPVNPSALVSGFLAALPVHLVYLGTSHSQALPPSTRLPSVAAISWASGCRPAPRHLYPAFSAALPVHLVCSGASRSRAFPSTTRLPSSVAVSGALGHRPVHRHSYPAFSAALPAHPMRPEASPFCAALPRIRFSGSSAAGKLLSRPSRQSEGRAGGVCEGDGSPLRTL